MTGPKALAFSTLIVAAPIAAEAETVINGRLLTDTGQPIAGYPLVVEGVVEGVNEQFVIVTDADGSYSLEGLAGGDYTVAPAGDLTTKQSFTIEDLNQRKGVFGRLFSRSPADPAVTTTMVPTIQLKTMPQN